MICFTAKNHTELAASIGIEIRQRNVAIKDIESTAKELADGLGLDRPCIQRRNDGSMQLMGFKEPESGDWTYNANQFFYDSTLGCYVPRPTIQNQGLIDSMISVEVPRLRDFGLSEVAGHHPIFIVASTPAVAIYPSLTREELTEEAYETLVRNAKVVGWDLVNEATLQSQFWGDDEAIQRMLHPDN